MKIQRQKHAYGDLGSSLVVQITLLRHFCKLAGLAIPTEKLMEFLNIEKDATPLEVDPVREPKE